MRKAARIISIAAIAVLLVAMIAVPASAVSTAPYKGYNYDPYGDATSAPLGYVPYKTYDNSDFGLDKALLEPEDFFVFTDEEGVQSLWIADTGNNRIIVVDSNYQLIRTITEFTTESGEIKPLVAPQSVFVKYNKDLDTNEIFVCTGGSKIDDNGKPKGECFIYSATFEGVLVKTFSNPTDAIIQLDDFMPSSVVVDNSGFVYIHVKNCTEGLVVLRYSDGSFMTYYGANKVVLTWKTSVQQTWKKIFSREASSDMISLTPTEMSGIFIDHEDFIYTTTSTLEMDPDLRVRKLNGLGENILKGDTNALVKVVFGEREKLGQYIDTRMIDICVDENGVMATLDAELGRVYLYDQTCTLLTVFGFKTDGSGNTQNGATFEPYGIDKMGENYLVLDRKVGTIVSYRPTYYISMLEEANNYYLKGWYIEGEEYWREVIKYDANFARGYAAIGKSLLEQEKYEDALEWLKKGQDRTSYSKAYTEYRREFLRENYMWFVPLVAAVIVAFILLIKLIQKLLGVKTKKNKISFN